MAAGPHADGAGGTGRDHPCVASSRPHPPTHFRTRPACGCPHILRVSPQAWRWLFWGSWGARCRARATLPSAVALYLIVSTPIGGVIIGPDPAWAPVTKSVLYAAIAMLVVGPLALGSSDGYARMLGSRPVVWLGEISYEIFLLHVVVMAVTMNLLLRWPLFTGSMAGLYADDTRLDDPVRVGASPADPAAPTASSDQPPQRGQQRGQRPPSMRRRVLLLRSQLGRRP